MSAKIAKILKIRNILKKYQKQFIKINNGCVLEGRDASTKILQIQTLNFILFALKYCSVRRFKELKKPQKISILRM